MPVVCTLNDMLVSRATIDIPRIGVWHADLLVDSFETFTGKAVIQFGSQTFNGTFARNGPDINKKLRARIIGGAGGLSTLLQPKGYLSVPIRIPLDDVFKDCGETRSETCETKVLNLGLDVWYRLQMSGSQAIDALLQRTRGAFGLVPGSFSPWPNLRPGEWIIPGWRVLTDGTVRVGTEFWQASELVDAIPLYSEPERGNITIYSDDPIVFPGETLTYDVPGVGPVSHKVSHVRHWITPRRMHTTIYYEE